METLKFREDCATKSEFMQQFEAANRRSNESAKNGDSIGMKKYEEIAKGFLRQAENCHYSY